MLKEIALVVGAGLASGLLYSAVIDASLGSVVLALLSPLPLFLIGLSRGAISAGGAGLLGALLSGVVLGTVLATVQYAVAIVGPITWLCRQALLSRNGPKDQEWYPPGLLLGWLAGIATAFFLAVLVFFMTDERGLQDRIADLLGTMMQRMGPGELSRDMLEGWAALVPGLSALWWMIMMLVNGLGAQAILRRSGHALRPTPRLVDIDLPILFTAIVVVGFLASFLPDPFALIGRTLAIIFLVPYFFLGLALLHSVAARWPSRTLILAIVYVLIFLLGWPVVVVAGLGIVEQFMGFRRRAPVPARSQEDE